MADVSKGVEKNATWISDGDSATVDPVAQQHELLVSEIESTDGHLGTALRSVYEGPEPDRFFDCLEARIKSHDKQIEHMCNHHYQGFIESVYSLLQVRSDVEKLKSEIQAVDRELQNSGQALVTKGDNLIKCHKIQQNIESATDQLTFCLPVLETYGKLRKQMAAKRYYPALKTLEQLEHSYLPRVSKYRFAKVMCDTIPKLRDGIKEASMAELKDFLESIRKHSGRIGEIAMKQTAQENGMNPALVMNDTLKKKRIAPQPPLTVGEEEGLGRGPARMKGSSFVDDSDSEESCSAQDLIDFSPVYRCLHIYSVLGDKETFESYYRKQRRKQGRLALQPSVAMDQAKRMCQLEGRDPNPVDTLACYKSYFHEIVGYFVVEDHISNTTTGLVNQTYIDELWDMALIKIVAVLRTHIGYCMDTQLLLQVKNLLMIFCLTLRGYGFSTSQLFELLLEVRDQYSEILRKKWVDIFNKIFEGDNYTPILVENQQQYYEVIRHYPYRDSALEAESFPKRLPFSQFVPAVFTEVKKYISACLEFSEDLHISKTDRSEWINTLVCKILEDSLLSVIKRAIGISKNSLLQLTQISINMEHLDQSCIFLEDFIAELSGARHEKTRISKLHGQSMFKSAKSEAEGEIYKQIDLKIEEFFELSSYDWTTSEMPDQPSGYIIDLVCFLRGIFQSFTNLPEKVAQTACMSACKHIAELMMNMLKDEEIKNISEPFLHQLSLDLKECEKFAVENLVSGLDGNTFKLAFEDLRQLLDLFISEEWANYFADYTKPKHKYLRVQPVTCIVLLEKLKEGDKKKTNLFSSFKRNERDKKKLIDTILKQLKQLISEQHQ